MRQYGRAQSGVRKGFVVFLALSFSISLASGQIEQVNLTIEGLGIAELAAKLEARISEIRGVSRVSIFADEDRVELHFAENEVVALAKVESTVLRMGMSLQYWILKARGELVEWKGLPALWVPKNQVKILLGGVTPAVQERLQELHSEKENAPPSKIAVTGVLQGISDPDRGGKILRLWIEDTADIVEQ